MTLGGAIFTWLAAAAGMFLVLAVWAGLQSFIRRRSGCQNPNKDVLEFIFRPCGGCSGNGGCHTPDHDSHHPEVHHETL